jgi:anti-sigma factor (TIGR02949 family)
MTEMSCGDAVKQFFAYLDRALAGEAVEALEAHIEACLSCCDRLAFTRQLDTFVRSRLPDTPVPEDLEARIKQALIRASEA